MAKNDYQEALITLVHEQQKDNMPKWGGHINPFPATLHEYTNDYAG
jgi:hypothetical protein